MPRSRSRSFESITRVTTSWFARKMPLWRSIASTSVVFPWSTWAMMAILRIGVVMSFCGVPAANRNGRQARSCGPSELQRRTCGSNKRRVHFSMRGPKPPSRHLASLTQCAMRCRKGRTSLTWSRMRHTPAKKTPVPVAGKGVLGCLFRAGPAPRRSTSKRTGPHAAVFAVG